MIGIIDYGMGNLGSIQNMLHHVGADSNFVSDSSELDAHDKIILPGVGHFGSAMRRINEAGLGDAIKQRANDGAHVLGICLGMQLLARSSDEAKEPGLGLLDAHFRRFAEDPDHKVPHMGWNRVEPVRSHPLLTNVDQPHRFYFVHTFYGECNDPDLAIGQTSHGVSFTSMYGKDNVVGVQFHPEKSHVYGMQLMRNFRDL